MLGCVHMSLLVASFGLLVDISRLSSICVPTQNVRLIHLSHGLFVYWDILKDSCKKKYFHYLILTLSRN